MTTGRWIDSLSARRVGLGLLLALAGCGNGSTTHDDAGTPSDAATVDAANATDGAPPLVEANIQQALNCGMPMPGAAARANDLQRHEADTSKFPNALCNDGTPAVLYYRPYRGAQNKDRWVISLRGGGSCINGDDCASRWCSCNNANKCPFATNTTNFTLANMSGVVGGGSQVGGGVMLRDGPKPNPIQDYNQVQFRYCSSDSWHGTARGVSFSTTHPATGKPVTYTMHFLGARVLDADLATMRQDGVPALTYTLDGGSTMMPDLDDATEVVLVGDSAGGAGVITNLDLVSDTLKAKHNGCNGAANCPPRVVGIIDAAVAPDRSRLDWSMSVGASAGIDTWPKYAAATFGATSNKGARFDASCISWHGKNMPGTEGACSDETHVVRHHVTTPFFVRMALLDQLVSGIYIDAGLRDPQLGAFTPQVFGVVLQRELTAFPMMAKTAEEGAAITVAPGVFAPSCTNHDTIHDDSEVYGVTIDPTGNKPYLFFDVFGAWATGKMPSAVLSSDPMRKDTVCPP